MDDGKPDLRDEYISRINKVQDYIEANLSEEFSLTALSKVANFSPFHFHRIFYAFSGETLFQFIHRLRLEKAAFLLLANPQYDITHIALECGFANQASFAKAFKKYFGSNASQFKARNTVSKIKDLNTESNMGKVYPEFLAYNGSIKNRQYHMAKIWEGIPKTVEVKDISEMKVIYIRHTGPYKKDAALFEGLFGRLIKWADSRNLIHPYNTKYLSLFHSNLELSENKIRVSVCMTVPDDVKTEGRIGNMTISGGKYAIGHFRLNQDQYQEAWTYLFADWLPESGYQPDDRFCFELYQNKMADNSDVHQFVDIYIPVKPL